MLEYNSNVLMEKRVHRKNRKKYKRYKICISLAILFMALLFLVELIVWQKLIGETLASKLMLCIGVAVIPVIVIIATVLVGLSGGADMMKCLSQRVVLSSDSFLYEMVPDARYTPGIGLIAYKYKWNEISKIVEETEFSRLTVHGKGYLIKYKDTDKGNDMGNVEKIFLDEVSVTLQGIFTDFEKMKLEIRNRVGLEKVVYGD